MAGQHVKLRLKHEHFNPIYGPLIPNRRRFHVLMGGAGSGKSFFCGQKVLLWLAQPNYERILLVRKVGRTIRRSQFQLLKDLAYQYKLSPYIKFLSTELEARCANGNMLISAGMDDPEKIKSIQGITKVWIEEATELTEEDFEEINRRLRGNLGTNFQIMLSFNPIDENHWLNQYFFLRRLQNSLTLHTTYKDNRFLDREYKKILRAIRDPVLRQIYLEGKWGVLKNIIYEPWLMADKYPSSFDEVFYGLDFGYNNPMALIEVGLKDGHVYPTERIYRTGLTTTGLIELMGDLEISKKAPIYCDSAEPDRIQELFMAGYNAHAGLKSVGDGIDFVKSLLIHSIPENIWFNKERQSYKWREKKDGTILDEPEKFMDHLMDALRYALYTHLKSRRVASGAKALG